MLNLTQIGQLFDVAYLAGQGNEDLARVNLITSDRPARVILDQRGTKHLIYRGTESPSGALPIPPQFHSDEAGGYITIPNALDIRWAADEFATIPQPYDVYAVIRDLEAVTYEGYFGTWIGLRNRGDHLSISAVNTEADFVAPTILEFNKRSIVRIRIDGANSRLWINNTEVPGGPVNVGTAGIRGLVYGTNSHAAQHDFYGMWIKFGSLDGTQHQTIYTGLAQHFQPGTFPSAPLAHRIRADWNNGSWTANYQYTNTLGFSEDTSKTQYQWYVLRNGQDLSNVTALPGPNAQRKVLVRADYPSDFPAPHNDTGSRVMVSVKVFDQQNNSWRFLRSPYALDNIP